LAVRLVSLLSDATDKDIPLALIDEARTAKRIAERLDDLPRGRAADPDRGPRSPTEDDGIVLLRRGHLVPFFLIHPIGGGVQCYGALAERLPSGHAVYGIHAYGGRFGAASRVTIESLAEAYVEAIARLRNQDEPLLLGGWSFGGVVAFEMARQIIDANGKIGLVGLIDSHLPRRLPTGQTVDEDQVRKFFQVHQRGDVALSLQGNDARGDDPPPFILQAFERHLRALHEYRPRPIDARIGFFTASERKEDMEEWEAPWAELALGGCDRAELPGDHFSLLNDTNVDLVAAQLVRHGGWKDSGFVK